MKHGTFDYDRLMTATLSHLESKGNQYEGPQERHFTVPQLAFMTKRAVLSRLSYLWTHGLPEYTIRNAHLGIKPVKSKSSHL